MQQQNIYTESLGRFYQNMAKPLIDLTQLNMETFNRVIKNTDYLNSFMQVKKPEDFMTAQIKFINIAGNEAVKYLQAAAAILLEAANHGGRVFRETSQEAMKASASTYKSASTPHKKSSNK